MNGGMPEALEKNWLPIAAGAGGAALLGAGRQGSPASQLGMGLVNSILGYYVNQAATADERARRQKIEDELLQRQRDFDQQNLALRQADVLQKTGRYDITATETPGAPSFTLGGRPFYFTPKPQVTADPWAAIAESAYGPEAAERIRRMGQNVPPEHLPALMQPALSALEVGRQRQQGQALSEMVTRFGRPTGEEYPGGVHTMQPPALSPQETAFYGAAIQTPSGQQKLLDTIAERLASHDPRFGASFTPTAGPGQQATTQITQEPGKPPRRVTTIAPTPYGQQADEAAVATRKQQAAQLRASPVFAKVRANLEPAAQLVLDSVMQDAVATGSPDSYTSAQNILMASAEPQKLGLQDLEARYFQKNPKAFQDYMQARSAGKDKEAFYLKQIASAGERKRYLKHVYDAQGKIVSFDPTLKGIEQEEATYWHRLAENDPQHYAVEAFTHLPRLLRWDRATFNREVKDFATRYGIPLATAGTP